MCTACHGTGFHNDDTDSGSGRTVYCNCSIGKRQRVEYKRGEQDGYEDLTFKPTSLEYVAGYNYGKYCRTVLRPGEAS